MISLILATRGRSREVAEFIDSLVSQNCDAGNVELIVVDQNPPGFLDPTIAEYSRRLSLVHVRDDGKGLSRARNIGLKLCSGDVCGFPDDDCLYEYGLLSYVTEFFSVNTAVDILSIGIADTADKSRPLIPQPLQTAAITPENVRGCSSTFFFRRSDRLATLSFDEDVGVGAPSPYQAGEEEDFVVRALSAGATGLYQPRVLVLHPAKESGFAMATLRRKYRIAAGRGYCIQSNRSAYRADFYLSRLLLSWAKPLRHLARPRQMLAALFEVSGFYRGLVGGMLRSTRGERLP